MPPVVAEFLRSRKDDFLRLGKVEHDGGDLFLGASPRRLFSELFREHSACCAVYAAVVVEPEVTAPIVVADPAAFLILSASTSTEDITGEDGCPSRCS